MTRNRTSKAGIDAWGIQTRWVDAQDKTQDVPQPILDSLRQIIGEQPSDLDDLAPIVTRPGRELGLGTVDVKLENGTSRQVDSALPDDFPLGYHTVRSAGGRERDLIVSPGRCWLPDGWRAWGWTIQLYAARSRRSWGIGDLADLRTLREWAQSLGAGFLLINPLHAVAPIAPQEASPYLPVTRRYRNPIYLCVEGIAEQTGVDISELADRGRALNDDAEIDRDAVWRLKSEALWTLFRAGLPDDGFDAWRHEQGESLHDFAVWCALLEENGPDWRLWDEPFQDPRTDAVRRFASDHEEEVAYYSWLQWQLARQFQAATQGITVLQDLPIGVSGSGADAWAWQDLLGRGASIGAPPDLFNSAGQDWGSPPLIPWQLRMSGYRAFIEAIRATIGDGGGLRIDHVMGLFRLWWVAPDNSPRGGAYIRYPSEDLLDIVALESHRGQAIVVGEDLGTVEDGVREALADHNLLSYRLLYFERDDPADWPTKAMAAVTTHDLPTVTGLWTAADLEEQCRYTAVSRAEADEGRTALLAPVTRGSALPPDATPARAVETAYRRLSEAPSVLLSATLEDALEVERRPNIPGSPDRANWRLPLPVPIEALADAELAQRLAHILGSAIEEKPLGA